MVLSSHPEKDCFLLKAVGPERCQGSRIALCAQLIGSFLMLPSLSGKGLFELLMPCPQPLEPFSQSPNPSPEDLCFL